MSSMRRGGRPHTLALLLAVVSGPPPGLAAPPPTHAYGVEAVSFEPLESPDRFRVEAVVVNRGPDEGPEVPVIWSVPALAGLTGALVPDSGRIGPIAGGRAEEALVHLEIDLAGLSAEARAGLGSLPVEVRIAAGDATPEDDSQSVEIPLYEPVPEDESAGVTIDQLETEVAPPGHEGRIVVQALVSAEVAGTHELHYTIRQEAPADREVGRGVEPVRPDEPMVSLTVPIPIRPAECGEEWSGRLEVVAKGEDGAELGRGSLSFSTMIPPGGCAGSPDVPPPLRAQ